MFVEKKIARKIGLAMAACTEVTIYSMSGYWLGNYLDQKILKTAPWLAVFLTFTGAVAGFIRLYKVVLIDEKKGDESSK